MINPQICGCRMVVGLQLKLPRFPKAKLHPPLPLVHGACGAPGAHVSSPPFPPRGAASALPCAASALRPGGVLGAWKGGSMEKVWMITYSQLTASLHMALPAKLGLEAINV